MALSVPSLTCAAYRALRRITMLDRLLVTSLAVLCVGLIAGLSYQYGHVQGELAALRAQQQAAVSQLLAAPKPQPEPAITTTPPPPAAPHVKEVTERVARSNAAALARLYALQAAAEARRAQEAAATLARLSQSAALSPLPQSTGRYGRLSNDHAGGTLYDSMLTRRPRPYGSYRVPKAKVIEHTGIVHVNPCPPGEKLISATCLPADSIILGQAPIPVRIVDPIFDTPIFEHARRQGRPSRNDVESGPMLPSLWQLQQPWHDGSSGPMLPSVWQLQQQAGPRR